jgi:nitrate reductase NapAB chaperone NapD
MKICSYLIQAKTEKQAELEQKLSQITDSHFLPSKNNATYVLVTERETSAEDEVLQETLRSFDEIDHFTLAFIGDDSQL